MKPNPPANARPKPVVMCILDGWGHRVETHHNAIAQASTPTWDQLLLSCPHALIETSGIDVGLPEGQMGNSEVGHMNIGGGRVAEQDPPRIDAAIARGKLASNTTLNSFIGRLKASGGTCHILGLISPGGVHSHQDQISALARTIDSANIPVRIHAFLDGRDTPPKSAGGFIKKFTKNLIGLKDTMIATISGRYYGMDRDNRWERIKNAYDVIMDAKGAVAPDTATAINASYKEGKTDEFMIPVIIGSYEGIKDGDGILMANFRADRARQILSALISPNFSGFTRKRSISFAATTGLTEYSADLNKLMTTIFPSQAVNNTLGEVVSAAGLSQLRIAETEKYAHVTFFLNGGSEREFSGETRILVPSPRVATYDLKPEMSAPDVTERIIEEIKKSQFDVIIVNYANGDMVGHTGIMSAAIKAAESIDTCLNRLEKTLKNVGGTLLITADHGNLEMMCDPNTNEPHTQHTVGQVPLVLVNAPVDIKQINNGRLADLAPTVLDLLGIPKPVEMTGRSLLHRATEIYGTQDSVVGHTAS